MRRRNQTVSGRRTPEPPTSPPGPKWTHSDHALDEEPITDFDGPGVDEQERVDSPIFTVVRERYTCRREGCDASGGHNHLYTLDALSERVRTAVEHAIYTQSWHDGDDVTDEHLCEYLAMNATIVEYDHKPILGITFNNTDTLGYVYPTESVERGSIGGECFGRPEEPSPDVHAHMYDEL